MLPRTIPGLSLQALKTALAALPGFERGILISKKVQHGPY